eukprot:2164160-Amphidinium_carterae.1
MVQAPLCLRLGRGLTSFCRNASLLTMSEVLKASSASGLKDVLQSCVYIKSGAQCIPAQPRTPRRGQVSYSRPNGSQIFVEIERRQGFKFSSQGPRNP